MQRFIQYKTFTLGVKAKPCSEQGPLVNGYFMKVFYKMNTTTFEWSQEWSSYRGLTVHTNIHLRLRVQLNNSKNQKFEQITLFKMLSKSSSYNAFPMTEVINQISTQILII